MVVSGTGLEASGRTCGLDSPQQSSGGARSQNVIHRLGGDRTQLATYRSRDFVDIGMWPCGNRIQHRNSWRSDT